MADYAVHRLRHNGRIIEPGEAVEGLTDAEWRRLHSLKAIRSEMHPVEVVEFEALELSGEALGEAVEGLTAGAIEAEASEPEEETREAGDTPQDLEEEISPIELDAVESVVEAGQEKPKRVKRARQGGGGT